MDTIPSVERQADSPLALVSPSHDTDHATFGASGLGPDMLLFLSLQPPVVVSLLVVGGFRSLR